MLSRPGNTGRDFFAPASDRTSKGRGRSQTGGLYEIGPVLWFLLFALTFPLLDLSTVGLRYTFLLGASRDAAQVASECKSFFADIDASNPSATNAASAQATRSCASFNGVHLVNVSTDLIVTNLATGAATRQSVPLAQPPDTTVNMYQIEVVLTADVDPLLAYRGSFLGDCPGLTGPARFVVASQQMCESPDGMTQ